MDCGVENFILDQNESIHYPIEEHSSPISHPGPVELAKNFSEEKLQQTASSTETPHICAIKSSQSPPQDQISKIRNDIAESIAKTLPEVTELKNKLQMLKVNHKIEREKLKHQIQMVALHYQLTKAQLLNSRPLQGLPTQDNNLPEEQYIKRRISEEEVKHKTRIAQLETQLKQYEQN